MPKRFPIHCTVPGPTFGDVVENEFTHNPIPEGKIFEIRYGGYVIRFRIDIHFYTNPLLSVVELVGVSESCVVKRPRLGG